MLTALAGLGGLAGCKTGGLTRIGTEIAKDKGLITEEQKTAIQKTEQSFRESFEDLTEEEEYYIGRAVAATLLSRYKALGDAGVTGYVNRVGRAVTLASSRPEIFNGYHFLVLDSDEVNAFAAPGGFIFITRGTLALAADEEALACVLAHEVAHVALRHGLSAIQKGRLVEAFAILGKEAGAAWNQEELLKLTEVFEGSVGDVVRTVIEAGYSRKQETEADRYAVEFAAAMGYDPAALVRFLESMESGAGGAGVFRTHGGAAERVADVRPLAQARAGGAGAEVRTQRFLEHKARL